MKLRFLDVERSTLLVEFPVKVVEVSVLGFEEVGKDVVETPTVVTVICPFIVVQGVASGIEHLVDGGGTAEGSSSGDRALVINVSWKE